MCATFFLSFVLQYRNDEIVKTLLNAIGTDPNAKATFKAVPISLSQL